MFKLLYFVSLNLVTSSQLLALTILKRVTNITVALACVCLYFTESWFLVIFTRERSVSF